MRRSKGNDPTGLAQVSKEVIYDHVFSNADREVGGVLVGRSAGHGGLPLVTGAIPALKADEQRANLTFTQDAWEHVHGVLDRDFPDEEQIVGWYHSHPGFGIFLSQHDVFIHQNFFGGASQIAVVVDPLAGTEGTFAWREEELVQLYERATPHPWEPLDTGRVPSRPAPPEPEPGYPVGALAGAAVVGVLLGLLLWQGVFRNDSPAPTAKTETVPAQRPSSATKTPAQPNRTTSTTPTAPPNQGTKATTVPRTVPQPQPTPSGEPR